MDYEIIDIGGLKTIFANIKDSNSTTVQILTKAGSIYEDKNNNGISHFLEHTFFKWWTKYQTPQKVAETIDQIWGNFNAFTGEEYAGYFVKSAPEFTQISLDVLSDMIVNAQFPEDEIQREKWVVLQEIKMYEDIPQRLVIDKWKESFYWDNSYWRPILGSEKNIKSFSRNDLFEHKNNLYTKDNMVLIISGNIKNKEKLKSEISKKFKNLPEKKNIEKPKLKNHKPQNSKDFFEKWTEQTHIVVWGKGYNIFDEERYAANLIGIILGWSMSSRLFQEIREKNWLCYYIAASHQTAQEDWIFLIRAGIEKEKYDFWIKKIFEEIEKIAKWEITEEEYKKALWFIKWKTKTSLETSEDIADFLWEQFLLKWKITSLEEMIKKYEDTKLEDIKKICNKLNKENLYTYDIR